ncbi:chemotaxis protein CheW [Myxococcota bacterium]|nr:chemotaxis protein CheW [Myxococcota bacterium]
MTTQQFATFKLDGYLLGIEVQHVQEIIRQQPITRVPLAASGVRGLINLRGQLVTAIDLRKRLLLPDAQSQKQHMNVVVRDEEGAVSLLVDEIGDVVEVNDDMFEQPPETLTGPARELIRGSYKMKDRLLLVLETQKVVS